MNRLVSIHDSKKQKTEEPWGSLTWIANLALSGSPVAVGLLILHKGFSDPLHSLPDAGEVIYVTKGNVCVKMGGEDMYLQPGDALTILPKVVRRIKNYGEVDAEMTLSYSSGIRNFIVE